MNCHARRWISRPHGPKRMIGGSRAAGPECCLVMSIPLALCVMGEYGVLVSSKQYVTCAVLLPSKCLVPSPQYKTNITIISISRK